MKITDKILSIPPYISTTWSNIRSLHVVDQVLWITLQDGNKVKIPDLEHDALIQIFEAHSKFVEHLGETAKPEDKSTQGEVSHPFSSGIGERTGHSFHFGLSSIEGLGSALQHNPELAHSQNLPDEMLEKVSQIAKIFAPEAGAMLPEPEPHCNCPHCQIARAIQQTVEGSISANLYLSEEKDQDTQEDAVLEEDLKFEQWEITQTGEMLFTVVNKLDPDEKFSVYLGHPVGCTCGKEGCEHILAVLRS